VVPADGGAGQRRAGLTWLSVASFVVAGLQAAGLALTLPILGDVAQRLGVDEGTLTLRVALEALAVALLLVAATGLWRRRRFSGRLMAHVYAAVALGGQALQIALIDQHFGALAVLRLLFPVLLLVLVDAVYRRDFDAP